MQNVNWWSRLCLASLLLAAGGCSLLRAPTNQTKALVRSFEGTVGVKQPTNSLALLQSEVMREADGYTSVVAQGADDFAIKVGTLEGRTTALQWKIQQATAAIISATGENPSLNAVDMVVLASLSRKVLEDYWVGQKYGQAALPLLEAQRKLERAAWQVADQVLGPGQKQELEKLLVTWWQAFPNQHYVGAVRLREFSEVLGKKVNQGEAAAKPNSVLNLLNIDPLSGLDPAVRAVEQTRYFAERMMFYLERAPMLLRWQVELLSFQVAAQPAPEQVLSNLNSLSQSAQVFAQTAEQLPKLINDQREAAINQLFAGIATERSNILASLTTQEAQLSQLLPQARQTLAAGSEMGNSLNGAIKSLDAFVRYVSPPETNPAPVSTNSQPFNVLDYGKAATQVGAMSKDLNLLLTSANQSATQLTALSEQVTAKAERVVDRAFRLGLVLVVLLLLGLVLAGLAYRAVANRLTRRPGNLSASNP
jgi:hypothetical protein